MFIGIKIEYSRLGNKKGEVMFKEMMFMTDVLDKKGVKPGDQLIIKPFTGKRKVVNLSHTLYDFKTGQQGPRATTRVLESIQGEKFHYQLKLADTENLNKKKHKRYILKSVCGVPFRLNGNWVFEGMLEIGDICELGYHTIYFEKKANLSEEFSMTQSLIKKNKKIIESELPILIEGETGVGKTSLAKEIHSRSNKVGHFVHINISSYSKTLLESELFGHVKGAFTGAQTDKVGALKLSSGGTLFIDEIDSLPLEIQTKLLIFLDEQKIKPVGGVFEEKVQTRIICASGKNLLALVEEGKMRMDFYYRIASGLSIQIPSLRDNVELIDKFCQLYSINTKISFTTKLIEFYKTLPWPGNIRQLKGHLDKKAVISNTMKLDFDELDDELLTHSSSLFSIDDKSKHMTMEELKVGYAKKVYFQCNKNLTLASKKLGISTKVLKRLVAA